MLETLGAFILVQLFATATRGSAFHSVIDVYLIYSMIIAAVLGAVPSVFAVILSVLGKWYLLFQGNHILKAEELENPVFGGQSSSAGRIIALFQ